LKPFLTALLSKIDAKQKGLRLNRRPFFQLELDQKSICHLAPAYQS